VNGAARARWRSPLGAVLAAALVLRLFGLSWGLPASDGWDDDGVAPRDFLAGVVDTYAWGHHTTYPPLHLLLLTVVTAPIWIAALLRAPSFAPQAVVSTFIAVPTMTALAVVARAVTVVMSIGLLWNVAAIGEALRGTRRAGAWAAGGCAACSVLTYYSQTSNLDVPYLFWGVFALRRAVEAMVTREPRRLRAALVLAALAVCTKDQAYAMFLLAWPAGVGLWLATDPAARDLRGPIARELAIGSALAAAAVLVIDGALVNPAGFAARVGFLLGPASQDHAMYAATATGYAHIARDVAFGFGRAYPCEVAPLAIGGVAAAALSTSGASKRAAGLLPALVAASFTLAFDMTARRTEDRFVLPQMVMCGIYAGLALDALQSWLHARPWLFVAIALLALVPATFRCAAVDAAMVLDPRYDAERWLRTHVSRGDRLEVYDNNVHLPRLPAGAVSSRVDETPADARSPIPGLAEVCDRFSNVAARDPRWIVVSQFWAYKYLIEPRTLAALGRVLSPQQEATRQDTGARAYFHGLQDGTLGYRRVHVAAPSSRFWPVVDIHASLDREIWIYERTP
jgi:hypothetical protein